MEVNAGGWAISHFHPGLKTEVLDRILEAENQNSEASDKSREIIGQWTNETIGEGRLMALYRKDKKIYLEETYGDGSSKETELVLITIGGEKRYFDEAKRDEGRYYVINDQGNIESLDNIGVYERALKKRR